MDGTRARRPAATSRLAANAEKAADVTAPPGREMRQDIAPHVEAWENFVALTKWSTIGIIVILGLLAMFLL